MPEGDLNDRPFLFVPHYPPPNNIGVDTGQLRPVPKPVIYYICNGIHFLNDYKPGHDLSFTIDVANWQGGNAASIAMVSTYWSPPLSGVTIPDPKRFLAFGSIPLPPHGGWNSLTLTALIPETAPPHICVLAKVFHALDMAPTTHIGNKDVEIADPINERHWAQHNISVIPTSATVPISFLATNPTDEERSFQLIIQPISRNNWDALRAIRSGEPFACNVRIHLSGAGDEQQHEGENTLTHEILLAPGEEREMAVLIESDGQLDYGTYGAYEVIQYFQERPTGGFAVVIEDKDP